MKIRFRLRDVDAIQAWGNEGNRRLHWFGLTDGIYCIDTPAGRLFEHLLEPDPDLGEPWCDYQVVQLFEDFVELWRAVPEPVPEDVISRYLSWRPREAQLMRESDDERLYLSSAPNLFLWRVDDEVRLSWRARDPWTVAEAELAFPYAEVQNAVAVFFGEFLAAMRDRVAIIERDGWKRMDCKLDVVQLVAEQEERESLAENALSRSRMTDWDMVRTRLTEIGA
jgi:hypothetical protein